MDNQTVQRPRPAEQELFETLSPEQLTLVASWLHEEVSINSQYYGSETSQSKKRLKFITERMEAIAQRLSNGDPAYPETPEPDADDQERPWRFSEEYWERYGKDD